MRHYRGKDQHNGQCEGRCNLCPSDCEAARALRQVSRHRQHQLTCPQSNPTPSPRVTEHGLCLSNTFETLRSLDQVFVLPTARRQVIRDTSIRVGSIKQGFSDLSFSVTPPSCSNLSPGAWVVTSIHLRNFAQSQPSLRPSLCRAAGDPRHFHPRRQH